ncbi:MAG: ice-binding family protein, partial [Patescibacteria group bacterium]
MKTSLKFLGSAATFSLALSLFGAMPAFAVATDPGLGTAASFSVIAQTSITGIATTTGNVAINSTGAGITAMTAANVGGTIYSTDGVAPSVASPFYASTGAQALISTAFTNTIPDMGTDGSIGPALDALTLTSGVYDIGAGRLNGGILHLDGPGIYIFRASSDFISSGSISLENGARACDVYWRVETLATINGASFVGTILAGTGVHFDTSGTTLNGRALAKGGNVTFINNVISGPTCAAAPAATVARLPAGATASFLPGAAEGTITVVKTVIG